MEVSTSLADAIPERSATICVVNANCRLRPTGWGMAFRSGITGQGHMGMMADDAAPLRMGANATIILVCVKVLYPAGIGSGEQSSAMRGLRRRFLNLPGYGRHSSGIMKEEQRRESKEPVNALRRGEAGRSRDNRFNHLFYEPLP